MLILFLVLGDFITTNQWVIATCAPIGAFPWPSYHWLDDRKQFGAVHQ